MDTPLIDTATQLASLLPDPQKKSPGITTVLLLLTAGTGGRMTAHSAAQIGKLVHTPYINVDRSSSRRIEAYSPSEQVSAIREAFGLNISDLASILSVTRPTIYAWLNGQEPKAGATIQIHRLFSAAKELRVFSLPRADKLIRRPIFEGQSLVDKIKAGEDLIAPIAMLKALSNKEMRSRQIKKGSGKSRRSLDAAMADSSSETYDRN